MLHGCVMSPQQLFEDGHDSGPLFHPVRKRRPPSQLSRGLGRLKNYKRVTPAWADRKKLREFWKRSMELTALTGIQHSVDHIVPLIHPLVCGLHCEANLEVKPLVENIKKSNNWWPDMWGQQDDLFGV